MRTPPPGDAPRDDTPRHGIDCCLVDTPGDPQEQRRARYWAAVERDLTSGRTVDAVLRLADSEQAELQARVAQARTWIVNCVDPAEVGVEVKRRMLDTLDGKP